MAWEGGVCVGTIAYDRSGRAEKARPRMSDSHDRLPFYGILLTEIFSAVIGTD